MSITTALTARRDALRDREAGFTLIELLVVVLIIGILAAIAIPVYVGVQNNAKDSGVQSDMASDKIAVQAFLTNHTSDTTPALPTIPPVSTNDQGKELIGDGFTYKAANYKTGTGKPTFATGSSVTTWCIDAVSLQNSKFSVSTTTGVAKGKTCADLGAANW